MCYLVPTGSAIITSLIWRKNKDTKIWWLNLMFMGGALFGVIDHIWNGELFLIGKNPLKDFSLGIVITMVIFVVWGVMTLVSKREALTKKQNS